MKIVHVAICGPFSEQMNYQENLLSAQNARDGHEVLIIASTFCWNKGRIIKVKEETRMIERNLKLIRINYDKIINEGISSKVRKSKKLVPIIKNFNPDLIFFHGTQSVEIINVARYKRNHAGKRFLVDIHADFNNSARNFLSYFFLHRIFYYILLKLAIKDIDKIYCVTDNSMKFLRQVYKYKGDKAEIFPLGGIFAPISDLEKLEMRIKLGISSQDIVFLHSGKIDEDKKTFELLEVFNKKMYQNMKLLIIGVIKENYRRKITPLLSMNNNVKYLGWKSGEELVRFLSISDVYIQPGTPSVTLQNAICAGNAIITSNKEIYKGIVEGNGWIINDIKEIGSILDKIHEEPLLLQEKKEQSIKIGRELLDYSILARKMYQS